MGFSSVRMRARSYDPTPRGGLLKESPIATAARVFDSAPSPCALPNGATVRMSSTGQVLDVQLGQLTTERQGEVLRRGCRPCA
jgi:hypothetical protein